MFARWRLRLSNTSVEGIPMKVCGTRGSCGNNDERRRRGECGKVAAPCGSSKAKRRKLKTVPAAAIGDVQASEVNKSFTRERSEEA